MAMHPDFGGRRRRQRDDHTEKRGVDREDEHEPREECRAEAPHSSVTRGAERHADARAGETEEQPGEGDGNERARSLGAAPRGGRETGAAECDDVRRREHAALALDAIHDLKE
jgi:hypothetical protein